MIIFQKNKKNKTLDYLRFAVFVSILSGILIFSSSQAQAGAWGEPTAAAIMKETMEQIREQTQGAINAQVKLGVVNSLYSQVSQLVGGNSAGGALFITDFNDFLYQSPVQRTDLYMNDFFTLTTRGKSASGNYISVGDTGNIGDNYGAYLESVGRQSTVESGYSTMNLEEYTPNPETMFRDGDFRAFNAFVSNPANNPYGYALQAESVYQRKLAQEQNAAAIEAQSSGFVGNKQGNKIISPAGSIEAALNNVQNLPNQIIAASQNPAELLSGVIAGMANKMVSNLVQKGVGQIQTSIRREISSVSREINNTLNTAIRTAGPGAQFINSTSQQLNVLTNSKTPPPPRAWKAP